MRKERTGLSLLSVFFFLVESEEETKNFSTSSLFSLHSLFFFIVLNLFQAEGSSRFLPLFCFIRPPLLFWTGKVLSSAHLFRGQVAAEPSSASGKKGAFFI